MKRSAPSTLQVTSKARRLLSPNLDLEQGDDEYEPDPLTEEEEEEEDADVDPDAPSWEVGPEAGKGIFERMTTTVSKCQPSIAPFRRSLHLQHLLPIISFKSKCNPYERRECQESGTIVDSFGVTITLTHPDRKFYCYCSNHASSPTPYATIPALSKHLQKVKAAWIGPEGTVIGSIPPSEPVSVDTSMAPLSIEDQQDGEPCPEEDKEWSNIDEGQQDEEEAQNKAKAQEEEEESEEEGHNKAKGQEPYPYKIFSTTMNYYEEESEGQDHKGTTNFDQKGKRKAIIMEDENEEDEDGNVNVDVDMHMDLDVDVDEDEEDEDEQEQEWEQEHEQEQEQEQEQEEPPSGFLYHPYLDTINLKVNWEFRFLICEVCKEAIKKQDVIGHAKTQAQG
ncbi:hypothetical protein EDC04DRAFT_2608912 [Pisolithus marmoratus]|nr:hypothetical protein EDC04DRAFT_2608912 [Pisolithus marmoratus]